MGLPGSGKSSLAEHLMAECPRRLLVSTDAIRAKLFGDEAVQGPWPLVWQELHLSFQQAVLAISQERSSEAIYDATNAVREYRREAIATAREIGFTDIAGLWLNTPVWLCLARNRRRRRQVPEAVILRMHRQLSDAPPSLADGFDRLSRYSPGEVSTEIAFAPFRNNRT